MQQPHVKVDVVQADRPDREHSELSLGDQPQRDRHRDVERRMALYDRLLGEL
jgi:hypothetical protein